MSELQPARPGAVATNDLLARARSLSAYAGVIVEEQAQVSVAGSTEEDDESFDWLQYRRRLLAISTVDDAAYSLSIEFGPWFDDDTSVCDLHEQSLDTRIRWALTDVAWYFADDVAHLGLAQEFLTVLGQPVPDDLGCGSDRALWDLQHLTALAVENFDAAALEELCARAVTMLLGLARAWPSDVDDRVPDLVDGLLSQIYSWAKKPWSLQVWDDSYENKYLKSPLSTPSKARVVSKAACNLEHGYEALFRALSNG